MSHLCKFFCPNSAIDMSTRSSPSVHKKSDSDKSRLMDRGRLAMHDPRSRSRDPESSKFLHFQSLSPLLFKKWSWRMTADSRVGFLYLS